MKDGPSGEATFDGKDPIGHLADLEDLGQCERRSGAAQLGNETLAPDDVVDAPPGLEDAHHPVVAQREHPGFAAMAEEIVGRDGERAHDGEDAGILGEGHPNSLTRTV